MIKTKLSGLRRYWIIILVFAFGSLSAYTSHPIYGAPAATPTPDVNTVPNPALLATPTNTPFPTPTAISNNGPTNPGDGEVAPTLPEEDNNNNEQGNSGDTGNGDNGNSNTDGGAPSSGGGAATETTTDTPSTQTDTTQTNNPGITGLVSAVTLNLRKGPSTTAHIVDTLFLNDPVQILGRDNSGAWWYICCGARTKLNGWVSKQFITADTTQANAIPLFGSAAPQSTAPAQAQSTAATTGNTEADSPLVLEMRPLPAFAWQGQRIDLQFVVHNRSKQAITNVQLRNDLPAELALVTTTIGSQGQVNYTGTLQSGPIFAIDWPEVRANGQVTATVTVQIGPNTTAGALIDNLAVVNTAQGTQALAGITIAMPPLALPQFR